MKYLILILAWTKLGFSQVVGDPSGSVTATYVPLNSSYGPNLTNSAFELTKAPLTNYGYPTSISNLSSTSGQNFGERCDFIEHELIERRQIFGGIFDSIFNLSSSFTPCSAGYICKPLDKLNQLKVVNTSGNDFQEEAGKVCLFQRSCNPGDKSPQEKCNDDGGSNCNSYSEDCYYTDLCRLIPRSANEIASGLPASVATRCESDSECSSGYCRELTDIQKAFLFGDDAPAFNKICSAAAQCFPTCTQKGNTIANQAEGYCCGGAIEMPQGASGTRVCVDPAELFPFGPPMFEVEFDDNNCTGFVYEKTDFSANLENDNAAFFPENYNTWQSLQKAIFTDVKGKKFYRTLRALEFLWAYNPRTASGSGEKNYDFYKIYQHANQIGERLRDGHLEVDQTFLRAVRDLEISRIQEEENAVNAKGSGNSVSAESAAGISNLAALSKYHDGLADYYEKSADLYYDVLGFKYNRINYETSNNFSSMQSSYDKLRIDNYPSNWPTNNFKRNSLAGVFYKIRLPESTGIIKDYDGYGQHNSAFTGNINPFDDTPFRRNLKCKNQEGDWIKADESDFNWALGLGNSGDIKNNSVCVKEMAQINGYSNQQRVELVDPIYPQGLMGNSVASNEYTNHPSEFPNTRRYRISKTQLKENINQQFNDYANESFTLPNTNSCVTHKRSIDQISDEELIMMVAFSTNSKFDDLKGLPLDDLIEKAQVQFASSGNLSWRENLARELTEEFIYETLIGVHQQKFTRDGFSGGVVGAVIAAIIIVYATVSGIFLAFLMVGQGIPGLVAYVYLSIGLVNALSGSGTSYNTSNNSSTFINQLLDYEFTPLLINTAERTNWNCTGQNCGDRKYLNSVSYKSDIHRHGLESIMNQTLFLESYGRAKQLYHSKVASCLADRKVEYENAYDVIGNEGYKLNLGANAPEHNSDVVASVTQECDPSSAYDGGAYDGALDLTSNDSGLTNMVDVGTETKEKLGENIGTNNVKISSNLGLGSPPSLTSDTTDESSETLEEKKAKIKNLEKDLKTRNNAILKAKTKKLERLKDLGIKNAGKIGEANAFMANLIKNQFKRTPTGAKLFSALTSAVSTSAVKQDKDKQELLEMPAEKNLDKTKEMNSNNNSRGTGREFYGQNNRGVVGDDNLDKDLLRAGKKVNREESDSLWEAITKTYLKIGIPRLFETKKKK